MRRRVLEWKPAFDAGVPRVLTSGLGAGLQASREPQSPRPRDRWPVPFSSHTWWPVQLGQVLRLFCFVLHR